MLPLILEIVLLAASYAHFVDVRLDELNRPVIFNATIPGLFSSLQGGNSSLFDVTLSMERESLIDVGREDTYDSATFSGEIHTSNNISLSTNYDSASRLTGWNNDTTHVEVGLGPRSFLLDTYESISLLKNGSETGVLIFNDSNANFFNTSCVSGSISPIALHYDPESMQYQVQVTYGLVRPARGGLEPLDLQSYWGRPLGHWTGQRLLNLSSFLIDELFDIITTAGGIVDDDEIIIRNCNRESLIDQLPDLTLTFHGSETLLVLAPDDYFHFSNSPGNECELKIARRRVDDLLYFNPLALKGVNIHITRNQLLLCDSNIETPIR
jgi:hypothetical protein